MYLASAAFAYLRLELPYMREWLDYQKTAGVDHVFLTLHVNVERTRELTREEIVWQRKVRVPYIMEGTENDLIKQFKEENAEHLQSGFVTLREHPRVPNVKWGTILRPQRNSYDRARKILLRQGQPETWLMCGDIDEFFMPVDAGQTLKQTLCAITERAPRVGALCCECIIHPNRFEQDTLQWDTYSPYPGLKNAICKSICRVDRAKRANIHHSILRKGFRRIYHPPIFVHHFRGFGEYCFLPQEGWPTAERQTFITKDADAPYVYRRK